MAAVDAEIQGEIPRFRIKSLWAVDLEDLHGTGQTDLSNASESICVRQVLFGTDPLTRDVDCTRGISGWGSLSHRLLFRTERHQALQSRRLC